jgi:hypothetical protein
MIDDWNEPNSKVNWDSLAFGAMSGFFVGCALTIFVFMIEKW